ncbi:MAG: hypothetical protein ACP5O3_00975 [Candidatus Micrarchaeia archaeon]|jgi:hypothetical protein
MLKIREGGEKKMPEKNSVLFNQPGIHPAAYPKKTAQFSLSRRTPHAIESIKKISSGYSARVSSYLVEGKKALHRDFYNQNLAVLLKKRIPLEAARKLAGVPGAVKWRKGKPVFNAAQLKRFAGRA